MTIAIQNLIEQRPHLRDPLELYARWQRFHEETVSLLPNMRSAMSPSDTKTYPRESAGTIFQSFIALFELDDEACAPLGRALEDGALDFMRFPLDEMPALPSLPYGQAELVTILFLLSRSYFLTLRETFPLDGSQWENGRCPLCSAPPALASITGGPQRLLHCSFCGTSGPYRFIGCPHCETEDVSKLGTLISDDEPGFRVATCDDCMSYVKVIEDSIFKKMTIDLADLASLPLDIVAQGKKFLRPAPNPIGLKKME